MTQNLPPHQQIQFSIWHQVIWHPIGGLRQVSFGANSDLLLVISDAGAGIFDCISGERIHRDYEYEISFIQEVNLRAPGVGPLEGQVLRLAGLQGGGLRLMTEDGWALEVDGQRWPHRDIFLREPWSHHPRERIFVCDDEPCELRAVGFSETAKSFVVATSCEIKIFARILENNSY